MIILYYNTTRVNIQELLSIFLKIRQNMTKKDISFRFDLFPKSYVIINTLHLIIQGANKTCLTT